jgi:hypothetical protein
MPAGIVDAVDYERQKTHLKALGKTWGMLFAYWLPSSGVHDHIRALAKQCIPDEWDPRSRYGNKEAHLIAQAVDFREVFGTEYLDLLKNQSAGQELRSAVSSHLYYALKSTRAHTTYRSALASALTGNLLSIAFVLSAAISSVAIFWHLNKITGTPN